jgi:aerobic-type carbon monoxide dehydrogenase small subunit (CoxS/CutS family)
VTVDSAFQTITVRMTVNSRPVDVTVAPRTELLDLLRNHLGLTGTKRACATRDCGACTVLIDGVAVRACDTPLSEIAGRSVTTIEGLARYGQLHPIQEAFIQAGAIGCGFCLPGMILVAKILLDANPRPEIAEIALHLSGHACPCGLRGVMVEAVADAARQTTGERET